MPTRTRPSVSAQPYSAIPPTHFCAAFSFAALGYYGCGNTYRAGSSSSYGQSYRSGDVISVLLDMDRRTVAFEKNDVPLGTAFTDIEPAVYPAVSLYARNDAFRIIEFGTF